MNRSLRIALAEDDGDLRVYCQKLLARIGHQVVLLAENGRQLVEGCHMERPDLVLTDVQMPELNGLQAARAIYQDRPTPIIAMSAHLDPRSLDCAESDHILSILVKPFSESALREALEEAWAGQVDHDAE